MTCQSVRSIIEAVVERDGSLRRATAHMDSCSECMAFLEDLRSVKEELSQRPIGLTAEIPLATIRAEVLAKIATQSPWQHRLRWAVLALVVGGSGLVGWQVGQREPLPQLTARLETPAAPTSAFAESEVRGIPDLATSDVHRISREEPPREEPPEVRLAAVMPPDPETEHRGGILLELESRNPNVVLYLVVDNQGDLP